jgi:hypothetical protein
MTTFRAQIILEKSQHDALVELSRRQRRSVSEIVREMIADSLKRKQRSQLELAARELQADYQANTELTALTALDGEPFLGGDDAAG